jgi:hypothetical protein
MTDNYETVTLFTVSFLLAHVAGYLAAWWFDKT